MQTELIIFAAKYLAMVSPVLFLYGWYVSTNKMQYISTALVAGLLAIALAFVASTLYNNPRPFQVTGVPSLVYHEPGNGFPSRHALVVGTIAAVGTLFNPMLGAVLWLLAFAVGAGRVLAGVHHTIDILASFTFALISAYGARTLLKYYFPRP